MADVAIADKFLSWEGPVCEAVKFDVGWIVGQSIKMKNIHKWTHANLLL